MIEAIDTDPVQLAQVVRAAADVFEVEEGGGFCASVWVCPDRPAVARLDRSIQGAPYEGAVLRWTMYHTTGLFGWGLFIYSLAMPPAECWPV